jgi:hypothetical protein
MRADAREIDMTNPTPVAVMRNDAPLVLLSLDPESPLAAMRAQLRDQGLILESDRFVDQKGFPIPTDGEAQWKLSELLARSDEKTVHVKSTEREAKKSLFSRLAEAAATEPPPEIPAGPAPNKDKAATLPEIDGKARQIETPLAPVTLGSDGLSDPVLLDKEAWKNIIERNNLLRGVRLDEDPPAASFRNAFAIIGGIPRFVVQDAAFISATVTHSESVHQMVVNNFSKVEASASYLFVASSFERTRRDSNASATSAAATHVVGRWNLPRVVVQLRAEDLSPDPALTAAVEAIVSGPGDAELKYFALRRVFRDFGQVWASEVTLGGQLTVTDTLTVGEKKDERSTETAMRLAVAVKIGAFKGGAGLGTSNEAIAKSSEFQQFSDKQFQATGGDTRLAQSPGSWVSTIGPAANWRVIGRRGLQPLFMLLDMKLQAEVREILAGVDARFMPEVLEAGAASELVWRDVARAEKDGFLVVQLVGSPVGRSEVWSAASGPNGIPGTPALSTTLWGPPAPNPNAVAAAAAAEAMRRMMALHGAGLALVAPPAPPVISDRIEFQTMTLPVRRRDLMMFEPVVPLVGAPAAAAAKGRWYEMTQLDEGFFGAVERVVENDADLTDGGTRTWTPVVDGFLLLGAQCAPGGVGDVVLREDEAMLLAKLSLDARGAGISHASACVPVRKGRAYAIVVSKPADPRVAVKPGLRFIPINPHQGGFGEPLERKSSVCYLAESDGFLFGCFSGTGKALVHATLAAGPDRDQFQKQEPLAATSLLRGASGCLGAPIRKNNYYYLHVTGVPEAATVDRMHFYPLRRF